MNIEALSDGFAPGPPARHDHDRYRTLFDSIDEGFAVCQLLFDAAGKPDDYRFLEINPAFEKQTGMRDSAGKRARELLPTFEM